MLAVLVASSNVASHSALFKRLFNAISSVLFSDRALRNTRTECPASCKINAYKISRGLAVVILINRPGDIGRFATGRARDMY